ncbi:MAG: c-type cytochrome biogenesis protein CcmI [Gammaproteobacteria bacterium]|nr:c-type cytochrome biogenesis protein CcmI [Gammaproteobacteria bacterium]
MMSFIPYSVLLIALALLFIAVPYLRFRPSDNSIDPEIRRRKNREVYESSLAELEKDQAEGVISVDEFEKLKTELSRSFLRDMDAIDGRVTQSNGGPRKLVPVLSLLFIPIFSYGIYELVGSARDLELPKIFQTLNTAESAEEQRAGFLRLAEVLEERFERKPDDIQNGYMLGTLYIQLEDFNSAINTFELLIGELEDGPDKATVLGQLAQAMYLDAGSSLTSDLQSVIERAMTMNSNEQAIMSILGFESFMQQDFRQAVFYWRRQLSQLNGNSEQALALRDRISTIEALLPPETAEVVDDGGASVTLVIDVDDSVRDLVDASMRLFVYARSPDFPMPLAAVNLVQPEFPFEITLTDANAMTPAAKLSSASQVYVGARLSRSGVANAQAGDIEAESDTFDLDSLEDKISISISKVVQ